ncbi:MAG: hypothetical protein QW767_05805 [Thermoprotei archaeon]
MTTRNYFSSSERTLFSCLLHVSFKSRFNTVAADSAIREFAAKHGVMAYMSEPLADRVWLVVQGDRKHAVKVSAMFCNMIRRTGLVTKAVTVGCSVLTGRTGGHNPLIDSDKNGASTLQSIAVDTGSKDKELKADTASVATTSVQKASSRSRLEGLPHSLSKRVWVVDRKGVLTPASIPLSFYSLIDAGVEPKTAWKAVVALFEAIGKAKVRVLRTDEVSGFFVHWLMEADGSGQSSRRYQRYMLGRYLVFENAQFDRAVIKNEVTRLFSELGLEPSTQQIKEFSDDVFGAIKRLSSGSDSDVFKVDLKLLRALCATRVANAPAVDLVSRVGLSRACSELALRAERTAKSALMVFESGSPSLAAGLASKQAYDACSLLEEALLLKMGRVPAGNPLSDSSMILSAIPKGFEQRNRISDYCRKVASALTKASNTNLNELYVLCKMTLKLSSFLQ